MKYFILFLLLIAHLQSQSINYEYRINWSEQVSGVTTALNCITSDPHNLAAIYACGKNGVVLKSLVPGNEWINIGINGIPDNIDLYTISTITPNIVVTAGNIGNVTYVYRSDNGGLNWNLVFTQNDGKINTVNLGYNYSSIMIGNPVAGRWSIWKSADAGQNWDSTGLYLPQNENEAGFPNSFSRSYYNTNFCFGTDNNRVYYSSNSGVNWVSQYLPDENTYSISSTGPYLLCGGTNLFSSSDYGQVWTQEVSPGTGNINGIVFPGIIIITPSDDLSNSPTFLIRNDNNIYYTDNGGGSDWEIKYSSVSGRYTNLFSITNIIYAVRDNGGITRGIVDYITSVEPNNYPYSFELKQNYPNPFNPKTTIPIYVYRTTHIKLNIYNSTGRLLETLVNERMNILTYDNIINYGYPHRVEWDATNYPSGVYYYEVIGDDFIEARKMMLVK
jgi:photosystem II stability/assembly factor-like uncharacterized protein